MTSSSLSQTKVDIALTFGRQFSAGLMQVGILLLIAPALGAEGTGTYAVALVLPTLLAQLLNLGLASANVYFVASERFPLEQVWCASRDLMLIMAVVGLTLGTSIIVFFGGIVFPSIPSAALLLALLAFPANLFMGIISSLLQALQDFRAYNIAVITQPSIAITGVFCVWLSGNVAVTSVLIVTTVAHFLGLIAAIVLLGRRTNLAKLDHARLEYLRPAIRYGMKAHLSNILSYLNYRIDMFLVNLFAGPAVAGVYTIAVRLTEQLWLISQAVSTVIFPRLSAMRDDNEKRRVLTPLMARMVFWVSALAAALLALVANPLIAFLFGAEFSNAYIVVVALLPGIVLFSVGRVVANDFASRGWVGINLALVGFVLIFNVIANLVLIPLYGGVGAAIGTSLSYVLSVVIRLVLLFRLTQIPLSECFIPTTSDLTALKKIFSKRKL